MIAQLRARGTALVVSQFEEERRRSGMLIEYRRSFLSLAMPKVMKRNNARPADCAKVSETRAVKRHEDAIDDDSFAVGEYAILWKVLCARTSYDWWTPCMRRRRFASTSVVNISVRAACCRCGDTEKYHVS